MASFLIKWKGVQDGPFSVDEIQRKFEDQEISAMHEVLVDGKWVTLRSFLRRLSRNQVPDSPGSRVTDSSGRQPIHPPTGLDVEKPIIESPSVSNTGTAVNDRFGGEASPTISHRSKGFSDGLVVEPGKMVAIPAGFWIRVMASMIDVGLVFLAAPWVVDLFIESEIMTLGWVKSNPVPVAMSVVGGLIGYWIYSVVLEGSPLQATLGKRCTGLRVIAESGGRLSGSAASSRFLWKLVSAAMAGSGLFLAAFSRDRKTFHDIQSGSRVIQPLDLEAIFDPTKPPT